MMLVAMVMEYLVGAAVPARERYPVATSKRYSKEMFELPHPIFTKEQPPLSRPFVFTKRGSGKQVGFFVQGLITGIFVAVSVPASPGLLLAWRVLHDVCVKD